MTLFTTVCSFSQLFVFLHALEISSHCLTKRQCKQQKCSEEDKKRDKIKNTNKITKTKISNKSTWKSIKKPARNALCGKETNHKKKNKKYIDITSREFKSDNW